MGGGVSVASTYSTLKPSATKYIFLSCIYFPLGNFKNHL